ncbi:MAG: GNAT family N-acetyltransferase [Gammaproteobacteria bacterium]
MHQDITLSPANVADLNDINRVIEAAVMTWALPERVKRLSLSSYRYSELDVNYLDMLVAQTATGEIVGIAAWETADPQDLSPGQTAMLLHGIYVAPRYQHQGIGRQLFHAVVEAAKPRHVDGLLVRAQEEARGFFLAQGMELLPVEDSTRHYAHRLWKPFSSD